MKAVCWKCIHLKSAEEQSRIVVSENGVRIGTDGKVYTVPTRNVSGGLIHYRIWDEHRCKLEQEDKYPNQCNFVLNEKLMAELDKRFPDLARIRKRL